MNIFSNFGSQLFRGSVSSTNSASYINKQNVNVLLDPSGTDYIDYSNNNSYFNDAHGININDENTTSLLLNNYQTLNPFSLSSLDEFTIYMKYKVHDVSNLPILGQIYINPNYEISFSNISPSIGDTFTVSVLNGSNTNVTYTISGDITSADLSYADMYGVLTDIENNLTYTLNSGLGKFIFTIDNTDISASFNVLKTYFVIVQNNVLGEPVFSFSETGEVGPYYNQPDLSFGAGSKNLFDVSDPTMADISFVFGTVVDNSSTIIDSFVTYQDGVVILDICSGYVGESLKYFEDTTAGMGYNLLNVTTQIGGDQWSQMGSAIDKTTPLRVSGSNSKLITVDEFVYEYNGSSWNQKGSLPLTLPNGPSTRTMCSISDDGSIILCAYDSNANANYQEEIESFTWNGSNWVLHGVVPISNSGTTTIRSDVKISGNGQVAVLGYWRYDLIEIYSWDGSTWILDLSYADTTTNSIEGGSLGWKVDCSEDGSVVLASGIGGPALFVKNNGTYSLQQQTGFPTSASYGEGSISADGTHVIFLYVTAWNVAYHYKVFAYDGSTWSQKGSNISSNYNVERSGFEDHNATAFINKDGSQVTTSNVNYSPNGMCYNTTYTFDGTSWIQTTSVTIQSVWSYGRTSQHVSSDGRLLVIGDRGYADKVYVYDIPKSEFNYTVTVSGDSSVFYLDDGINGVIAQPDLQFESGTLYKFDQSDPTNAGNTLVLGTVYDSSTNIIDYQTIVGTPGQPGAYTSFTASGETVYYSFETPNMGYKLLSLNFSVASELNVWATQNSNLNYTELSDSYTLSGSTNTFANGTYILTVSDLNTTYTQTNGNYINQVFNNDYDSGHPGYDWPAGAGYYTSGVATSSHPTSITATNNITYRGSSIQLSMPYSLLLKQISARSESTNSNNPPKDVVLLGSNDNGQTFDLIVEATFPTGVQTAITTITPTITNTTAYNVIRMVISNFHGSGGNAILEYFDLIGDVN